MDSSIALTSSYDEENDVYIWSTHSRVNTHIYFCCEENCDAEVYTYTTGGCCDNCSALAQRRDLAERFYLGECYAEQPAGFEAAKAWYLGELGEPPTLQQAYDLGKKIMLWIRAESYAQALEQPHICEPVYVDNGSHGYYFCDNEDDPRCPSNHHKKGDNYLF